MLSRKISRSTETSSGRYGRSANCGLATALIGHPLSPLPLGERVDASVASGRERGSPKETPLPPHSRFAFARHPLPQGERGRKKRSALTSSRHLPRGAVLGILEHDAHGGELVAEAVGLLEVLGLARRGAGVDQRLHFRGIDIRSGLSARRPLRRALAQEAEQV